MKTIRTEIVGNAALLMLDSPPLNLIGHQLRTDLMQALDWAKVQDVERVVISGAGKAFSAGADAKEFGKKAEKPDLPDIIASLENFPVPCVAAINGAALGGGMEITLGCSYRIAAPGAKMGLVEVNLGVVPGAGGTQRLPRLVGMKAALDLIPQAKTVDAAQAASIGLVDAIAEDPVSAALSLDMSVLSAAIAPGHMPSPATDPDAASSALSIARKKMRGIEAPNVAIDLIASTSTVSLEDGLAEERAAFLRLRQSEQAAALRHAFFAERHAASFDKSRAESPQHVNLAIVVGGGNMGAGIAISLATAGVSVTIVEIDQNGVARANESVQRLISQAVKRGKMSNEKAAEMQERIGCVTGYDNLPDADLAIEAVVENMDVKKAVLASLESALPEKTILATNTSYLDIDEMAESLSESSRLLGLHFFNPAHIMKLLEIIKGRHTSGSALATSLELAKRLRKIPVLAGVCDGFIGNRILARYRQASDVLVAEGATPWEVDAAMRDFGFPMGPYEVQDLAGLDIAYANRQRQGLRDDPKIRYIPLVEKLVEDHKRLGRKSSAGWYDYSAKSEKVISPIVRSVVSSTSDELNLKRQSFEAQEIQRRILLAMIDEACAILEEGIAARPVDIDLALLHGYGFPRWRGGLMFYADKLGAKTILTQIEEMQKLDPLSWRPTPLLKRLATQDKSFSSLNELPKKEPANA